MFKSINAKAIPNFNSFLPHSSKIDDPNGSHSFKLGKHQLYFQAAKWDVESKIHVCK